MMRLRHIFICSLLLFVACKSEGVSNIPEIPDDPVGTRSTILSRGGSAVFLDDTGNGIKLAENGALQGENLYFTSSKKSDGLVYVTEIPLSSWNSGKSAVLKSGDGLVVGSRMSDGVTFTRLFVAEVNDVTGDVVMKSHSPFYGDVDEWYLYHNKMLLNREPGDTIITIRKPTTYNVRLALGEWASIKQHITYVQLEYSENRTREIRYDTLIFSNGVLPDKRLPIEQSNKFNDDIILK